MNKIGIVGQIGLALIAPYAMPMLGSLATTMMGTTLGGISGAIVKGAGQFLNVVHKVGTAVGSAFKSVTEAVTGTLKNVVGATLNKAGLGDMVKGISGWDVSSMNFKTAFEESGKLWSSAGDKLTQVFSKSTWDTSLNQVGLDKLSPPSAVVSEGELLVNASPVQQKGAFAALNPNQGTLASPVGTTGSNVLEGGAIELASEKVIQPASLLSPATLAEPPLAPTVQTAAEATVQTAAEATALDKAKEALAEAGMPTTLMGAAKYMAALDVEYDTPRGRTDYVDYSALQTSPIYPSSEGLQYANMLRPDAFDAPSLVDSIMNKDYKSIYTNSAGKPGYYFGFPSLVATMTQNAQEMLYEYE